VIKYVTENACSRRGTYRVELGDVEGCDEEWLDLCTGRSQVVEGGARRRLETCCTRSRVWIIDICHEEDALRRRLRRTVGNIA
jgi:hypothetical protein